MSEKATEKTVKELLKRATLDAETQPIPSEEITYTEMMEYLEHTKNKPNKNPPGSVT